MSPNKERTTGDELADETTAPGRKPAILSADFLRGIAHAPGVYLMKASQETVLYVGKARDLRRRLASYQRHLGDGTSKTGVMLAKTVSIETILTATEKEALLLEASLIKRLKPRYNIILRDDKSYPYLTVTVNEEWPRLLITRRRVANQPLFGPFASPAAMWETVRLLNSLFPLRRCKGAELRHRDRPCLNHQMHRCLAPCHGGVSQEDYRRLVDDLLLALSGRNKELLRRLTEGMQQAAEELEFEQAASLRDKIAALSATLERQVVAAGHHRDQDVFGLARQGEAAALAVLLVRQGMISGHHQYFLPDPWEDDARLLGEALERFYEADRFVPDEVLVSLEPEDREALEDWLSESKGRRVAVRVPQRGDLAQLMVMADRNARQVITDHLTRQAAWDTLATDMARALHLRRRPERIVCLDISHLGGEQSVGAVVSFWQGKKESDRYRHYRIESVQGPDDYAAMTELLGRHLRRAREEGFPPDLVLVDGGKGQLRMACQVVAHLGLEEEIDLVGIAKERQEEGEKLFLPGRKNPLTIARHSQVLLLLMRIRDEAHRFGLTFHRNWRQRDSLRSDLDAIPGIGPARRRALLTAFGSLARVAQATEEELAAIPGISPALAALIHARLRAEGEHPRD